MRVREGVCVSERVAIIHGQRAVPKLLIQPARRRGKGRNGGDGKHKKWISITESVSLK